ncbi:MAG: DUF5658 family protein [Bacillota bacterium]|nr:DUF5658 family protein [Bacillota bacterium]MDW7685175.1 DUF5658 family protein [Bacillota bacterium]
MAVLIWLLGLVDVLLTKYGLTLGVIREGNPVMAWLFAIHPNVAVLFSLLVSGVLLWFLTTLQAKTNLAVKALWGLLIVRILVIVLHVGWLVRI